MSIGTASSIIRIDSPGRYGHNLRPLFLENGYIGSLPLSGASKLVLFLVIAAIVPARISRGQPAPAPTAPADSATTATEIEPASPSTLLPSPVFGRGGVAGGVASTLGRGRGEVNSSCGDEQSSCWACSRPLCSLLERLKADSQPVPWANWSEHPLSVGCFAGAVNGGPLIEDWVGTTTGFIGGWRLGWDIDPDWGTEMRMAFGSPALYDSYRADQALIAIDNANGLAANDPRRARFDHREASIFQWDVDILCYPWGETRLRPYFLTGMGLTNIAFTDRLGQGYQNTCLSLPLGMGLKYLCSERLSVRLDLLDDIAFRTDQLETQENISLTAGVEVRFGGSRKVYWPWDPGRSFW